MDGADGRWIVWSASPPSFDVAALTDAWRALAVRSSTARVEALALDGGADFAALLRADSADVRDIDPHIARISSTSTSCRAGGPACTMP